MHNIKYLRVIVTDKCNLNCFFCHKEGNEYENTLQNIDSEEMLKCIKVLIASGIKKVKFMGGEPTLCSNLPYMIKTIKNIAPQTDVSIISNGIANQKVFQRCIDAGIDRINISMHGFDMQTFKNVTKGTEKQLYQLFENIDILKHKKILGKINYVLLKGVNEEEFFKVLEYIHKNNLVLDVLNYLDDNNENISKFYYSFSDIVTMISKKYQVIDKIKHENINSIDSLRLILANGGSINLKVNQLKNFAFLKNCKSCPKIDFCNEGIAAVRLTNYGFLKPCLFRDDNMLNLLEIVRFYSYDESIQKVTEYFDNL